LWWALRVAWVALGRAGVGETVRLPLTVGLSGGAPETEADRVSVSVVRGVAEVEGVALGVSVGGGEGV
jgi:hypothetical protein